MSVALVHLIPTLMERQLGECIEHNGQVFGLTRAGNGTIKIETKTARVIVLAHKARALISSVAKKTGLRRDTDTGPLQFVQPG
jgi:hypothetical protein